MSEQHIVDACENLWGILTKDKKPVFSCEADRRSEGTYINGFRNDIQTWTHEQGGFAIRAKRVDWQTYNLAADRNGNRRTLEILQGEKVVFRAIREGSSTTKKFGAQERYIGTDQTPESPWQVAEGEIPLEVGEILS